jgi:DEAD/DEAH box helicase domain-containing protein
MDSTFSAVDPTGGVLRLLSDGRPDRLRHIEALPARGGETADWPGWADPLVVDALRGSGVTRLWRHQRAAAEAGWRGEDVVLATGTASGKSAGYLLPTLTAIRGRQRPGHAPSRGCTALYLAPTKALAHDQLRLLRDLAIPDVVAATVDGDGGTEEKEWARRHAQLILSNPDMLHRSLLPGHRQWERFFRRLTYVIVDECHIYRGVFGSGVAAVLRRLQRVAESAGAEPRFLLASATVAEPDALAAELIGRQCHAITDDAATRSATTIALWQPPLLADPGERGAPQRRGVIAETVDLLVDLVVADVQTLAFVRSRRGAEAVAAGVRDRLAADGRGDPDRVAAYRGGYLPEDRRALEAEIRSRRLLGLATTSALELGVDITGVDAVLMAGWPGTRAAFRQQAGRAGRAGREATAILIARDDPLDQYLVEHPEALFGRPVEATVLDPANPYVLAPHLAAAAAELPLVEADLPRFGPTAGDVVAALTRSRTLRRRDDGWYWARRDRAADLTDLRGIGGPAVRLVEERTGRVLGTVDAAAADRTVHDGAIYVQQGRTYRVLEFDQDGAAALLRPVATDESTTAREVSDLRVLAVRRSRDFGPAIAAVGEVEVTRQVVSYLIRRASTGQVLGEMPLELPERRLRTVAVWWTVPPSLCSAAGITAAALPGAAHAAEHAAIGLLPLVATCDRWDIGGLSTPLHPDVEDAAIFVYDGYPGGAGFAERGYDALEPWLTATRDAIAGCGCSSGCPACVQSPKCGNGNDPLDKAAARRLLDTLLS